MPSRQTFRASFGNVPAFALALAVAAGVAAPPLGAEEAFFEIDPSRSQLTVSPGSQSLLSLPQAFNGFGFGDRVMPHMAQPGLPAGQLPNGDPSDGLSAGLGGLLSVDIDDLTNAAPTLIRFVRESSSIEVLPSGSWRPSTPPIDTGAVAPAGWAVRFEDPALDVATEVALRNAVFSVASAEAAALASTGPDAWSFPAGCASPAPTCPALRIEAVVLDVAASGLPGLRRGFRSTEPFLNSVGTQGTLTRDGSGDYELTLPIAVTVSITASDMNDPLGTAHTLELSGQVVAVPEPSAASLGIAALLALAALAARWRPRSGLRWVAAGMIVLGVGSAGCKPTFVPSLDIPSFYNISCQFEFLAVRKDNGAETIFADAGNQPCSIAGRYFEGTFAGTQFDLFSKVAYQIDQPYFAVGITMNPASTLLVNAELDYRARLRVDYGATDLGGPAQLYVGGLHTGFGSASDEFSSGFFEVGSVEYPLDGTLQYYDLDPAGGSVDLDLRLDSLRMASGLGYQGASLQLGIRPNHCLRNWQCKSLDPGEPFCALDGSAAVCLPGISSSLCSHSSQCADPLICRAGICRRIGLNLRF